MSNYDDVVRKLQLFTRERRVRWKELIKDFDRHKIGVVSEDEFRRGLSLSGAVLDESELRTLVDELKRAGEQRPGCEGKVDYRLFCDLIDAAFVSKGLEKTPSVAPQKEMERIARLSQLDELSSQACKNLEILREEERQLLQQEMLALALKIKTENIVLKRFWIDFDRHRCGFVSKSQFKRGLTTLLNKNNRVSEIADILAYAYENARGDVNYRRLSQDITVLAGESPRREQAQKRDPITLAENNEDKDSLCDALDLENALQAMRMVVSNERLALRNFFVDADKMRSGYITRDTFKKLVNAAFGKRLHFNNELLEALADRYSSLSVYSGSSRQALEHAKVINYRSFEDDIDSFAAARRDLQKEPSKNVRVEQQILGDCAVPETADEEEIAADPVMAAIQSAILTRRLNLKPAFLDYDRLHRGVVTVSQFKRVLSLELAKVELSDADLEKIAANFSRGVGRGVEYIRFLRAMEPTAAATATPTHSAAVAVATSLLSQGVAHAAEARREVDQERRQEIVAQLQHSVAANGIRLAEFLSDADKRKSGEISVNQFERGISRARVNVHLSTHDLELLVQPFISSENDGKLRWRDLLAELEQAEVTRNLERAPQAKPASRRDRKVPRSVMRSPPADSEEERELDELLEQIRRSVLTDRVSMLPAFKCRDKHNSGKLGLSLFRRCLGGLCLKPLLGKSEDVFQRIGERFADTRGTFGLIVNYVAFVDAVSGEKHRALPVVANNAEVSLLRPDDARLGSASPTSQRAKREIEYQRVLKSTQDQAWSRGIRIKTFFEDFDRLRKGLIPSSKFCSALTMSGLTLSVHDVGVLAEYHASSQEPSLVSYLPFVFELDGGDTKLEADPTGALRPRIARRFEQTHPATVSPEQLEELLNPIRQLVRVRHLHLLEPFKDRDRKNLKAITKTQFASVLKTFGLIPMENFDETINVLHRAYPAKHHENISYCNFVRDLERATSSASKE